MIICVITAFAMLSVLVFVVVTGILILFTAMNGLLMMIITALVLEAFHKGWIGSLHLSRLQLALSPLLASGLRERPINGYLINFITL